MSALKNFGLIALFFSVSNLTGCGSGSGGGRYDEYEADTSDEYNRGEVEADTADVDAADVVEPTFDNCTDDCSGHEAGFQWAQDNDVTDSSECGGNSDSFIEGCEAFAQERETLAQEQAEEAAEEEASEYEEEEDSRF
jgi:hypothetical protein